MAVIMPVAAWAAAAGSPERCAASTCLLAASIRLLISSSLLVSTLISPAGVLIATSCGVVAPVESMPAIPRPPRMPPPNIAEAQARITPATMPHTSRTAVYGKALPSGHFINTGTPV